MHLLHATVRSLCILGVSVSVSSGKHISGVQNWKTSAENVTDPNILEPINGVSVAGRTPGCPCC
jgi:hypothetical protein